MVTIVYQNQYEKQFVSDVCFEDVTKAKEYLRTRGFTESNRIFTKSQGWSTTKAYVHKLELVK